MFIIYFHKVRSIIGEVLDEANFRKMLARCTLWAIAYKAEIISKGRLKKTSINSK